MRNWKDKISEYISYTEATKSNTAINFNIDNTPDIPTIIRMKYVAKEIFEPLRKHFEVPISVSSFYRSKELNKKVGGSKTSDHIQGQAMDLDADVLGMITNKEIFDYIKENLEFDQLIWEHGDNKEPAWVHVSYDDTGNRNQILKTYKGINLIGQSITKYKLYDN